MEELYENVCTLTSEPDLCFNYATNEELNNWGFSEGCFTCLLQDKKDVFIQVIATYMNREGASMAYNSNVDYLKKHDYGHPVNISTPGESSILFRKKQSDGVAYNLIFLKNRVHVAISGKYKKDDRESPALWYLPRPPAHRTSTRRKNLQAPVRPPRGQPPR